jgi:hypothetical protein
MMVAQANKLVFISYVIFFSLRINFIKAFLQLSLPDGFTAWDAVKLLLGEANCNPSHLIIAPSTFELYQKINKTSEVSQTPDCPSDLPPKNGPGSPLLFSM